MLYTVRCPKCGNVIRVWQTATGGGFQKCYLCGFDAVAPPDDTGPSKGSLPTPTAGGPVHGCVPMTFGCAAVALISFVAVPLMLWTLEGQGSMAPQVRMVFLFMCAVCVLTGIARAVQAAVRRRAGLDVGGMTFFWAGALIGLGVLLIALGLPPVSRAREAARRTQCRNNLHQLVVALRNYEEEFGVFPPAVTYGPDGRAMHGWGVNLLPFIEEAPLYRQYDPAKPWDDPANAEVVGTYLEQYQCPNADTGNNTTSYRLVVCPGSVCGLYRSGKLEDITDSPSQTIIFVECAEPVPWASPKAVIDLRYGFPTSRVTHRTMNHEGGFFAAFADSRVIRLRDDADHMTLIGLCTKAGGEKIDEDDY